LLFLCDSGLSSVIPVSFPCVPASPVCGVFGRERARVPRRAPMARVCLGGGRGGLEIMVGPQCNNADAIIGDPQCDNANEDIGAACVKTSKRSWRRTTQQRRGAHRGILGVTGWDDHRWIQCARRRSNHRGCVEEVSVVVIVAGCVGVQDDHRSCRCGLDVRRCRCGRDELGWHFRASRLLLPRASRL